MTNRPRLGSLISIGSHKLCGLVVGLEKFEGCKDYYVDVIIGGEIGTLVTWNKGRSRLIGQGMIDAPSTWPKDWTGGQRWEQL